MGSSRVPEKGYLYSVCGKRKFIDEAIDSAKSLKRVSEEAHVSIITTNKLSSIARKSECVDKTIEVEGHFEDGLSRKKAHAFKAKKIYYYSPYEYSFFVDSDTYFIDNCESLFELLDTFDICLSKVPLVGGDHFEKYDIPYGYDMYNSGLVLFRKNEKVQKLFSAWGKKFAEEDIFLDQKVLSMSIYESEVRVYTLSNGWNARFGKNGLYKGRVKMIHGRHKNMEKISKRINESEKPRIWLSKFETCIYEDINPIYIAKKLIHILQSVLEEMLRRLGIIKKRYK